MTTSKQDNMAYLGGLNKSQFAAFLADELKPFIQEIKDLKGEISRLKEQLNKTDKELYTIEDVTTVLAP